MSKEPLFRGGGGGIPQIIGLTKDDAGSLPNSNIISKQKHVLTHLNGTAIDPGGQKRGFSHQRDSFLLRHKKHIINPQMQSDETKTITSVEKKKTFR